MIGSILEFVIALGILITLHELGHLLAAKLMRIEVEEFGLGFPPRIARLFTWGGTEFTLNWIPLGGFVRPRGENDPEVPGGLAAANPWKRLFVLLGGSTVNIITGILLFSLLFTTLGTPDVSRVRIMGVVEGSPAQQSGLQVGDEITAVNGEAVTSIENVSQMIKAQVGKEITITVLRSGQTLDLRATPRVNPPPDQGALGISLGNPTVSVPWIKTIPTALQVTWAQVDALVSLPAQLIRGDVQPEEARMVGPVGIFSMYDQSRESDIENAQQAPGDFSAQILNRLALLATISVALGITNLLPIPALDGGRILFVLPEILFRRRVPAKYENLVHLIGFAALLLLMIYITTQDILRPIQLP